MQIIVYDNLKEAKDKLETFNLKGNKNIFFTNKWMQLWLDYFGSEFKLELLTFYSSENELLGFVPLCYKEKKFIKGRDYKILGDRKSSYLHLPILDEYKKEVYLKMLEFLNSKNIPIRITFNDISDNSEDYLILEEVSQKYSTNKYELYQCPYSILESDWNDYFNTHFKKKKRTELRKFRSKLENLGEVNLIRIRDKDSFNLYKDKIEETFIVHHKRFQSVLNSSKYSDKDYKNFYFNLMESFAEQEILDLSLLCLDNHVISFLLAFKQGNILIDYIPAFDPSFSKYSLGHVHLMMLFEDLCNEKTQYIFDFSKGVGLYKQKWADGLYNNYSFTINLGSNPFNTLNLFSFYSNIKTKIIIFGRKKGINKKIKTMIGEVKNRNSNTYEYQIEEYNLSNDQLQELDIKEYSYRHIKDLNSTIKEFILNKLYLKSTINLVYKNSQINYIICEDNEEKKIYSIK
jgi:hypothetical protein